MELANVSRETLIDIDAFEEKVLKWSKSINLIAKSTASDIRGRHTEDSLALFDHIPSEAGHLVDIGSGGGFPGIVLAIMAKHSNKALKFTLIESDQRKAAFLRVVGVDLDLDIDVVSDRIESTKPSRGDVVTARALAPLPKLLGYIDRHIAPDGIALLPKGRNYTAELALAREVWEFDVETIQSKQQEDSVILKITGLREKEQNG